MLKMLAANRSIADTPLCVCLREKWRVIKKTKNKMERPGEHTQKTECWRMRKTERCGPAQKCYSTTQRPTVTLQSIDLISHV